MKASGHDLHQLDLAALAAESAQVQGRWPLTSMTRLAEDQPADSGAAEDQVTCTARGQQRPVAGAEPEIWLHLVVNATVWRECQRCLQPVALPIALDSHLRFVKGEAAAAALDEESEDDVLELPAALDLRALVEDELLLALPVVPRHEHCPQPLPMQVGDESPEPEPSPFAVLAALKRDPTAH
jgi:uncharacterized protein